MRSIAPNAFSGKKQRINHLPELLESNIIIIIIIIIVVIVIVIIIIVIVIIITIIIISADWKCIYLSFPNYDYFKTAPFTLDGLKVFASWYVLRRVIQGRNGKIPLLYHAHWNQRLCCHRKWSGRVRCIIVTLNSQSPLAKHMVRCISQCCIELN